MSNGYSTLVEVMLLVDSPRQRLSHWTQVLAPLDGGGAPPLAQLAAYYDPTSDQALIDLRYDEEILGGRIAFVIEVAQLAEVGIVRATELTEGERRRFFQERLSRCTHQVTYQRTVVGALTEVVRKLKENKSVGTLKTIAAPLPTQPPPIPTSARRPSSPPPLARGDTSDPVLLVPTAKGTRDILDQPAKTADGSGGRSLEELGVPPPMADISTAMKDRNEGGIIAKGTRDDLSDAAIKSARIDGARVSTPMPKLPSSGARRGTPGQFPRNVHVATTAKHVVERVRASANDARLDDRDEHGRSDFNDNQVTSAPANWTNAIPTVDIPPDQLKRLVTDTEIVDVGMDEIQDARPSTADEFDQLPTLESAPAPIIYARYLRSGRWMPTRIGALSLKGAALMAHALPRLHDHVDVALTFGAYKALVRGCVGKLSTEREVATTGASTFSVKFELDDASRRQLTALLKAARAEKVVIKPPPARTARRFPVEWPVCLGTTRGAIKGDAFDVSSEGMFVRPSHPLHVDTILNFSVVLDDASPPVAGRAKVVRHVAEAEAKTAGLQPGFGLQIMEMGDDDRARWLSFVGRVERRAEKRVLVGAAPARLAELQTALASLGYAVTGGTDPGALVQLASAESRPVDAALIDANWLQNGASASWIESLFSARNVPCVTLHGDARKARTAVDKLLQV